MKRRELLAGAGAALIGSAVGAGPASAADAYEPYSRESYDKAIADGGPFMLDFYASW